MLRRQRNVVLDRNMSFFRIAQRRRKRTRTDTAVSGAVGVIGLRLMRKWLVGRHVRLRFRRERHAGGARVVEHVHRPCRPDRRFGSQGFGKALQLRNDKAERDDDQTTHDGGDAGLNQGVSEAELFDRNTKSDHHGADHSGQSADSEQNTRHTLRSSTTPAISPKLPAN